MYLNNHVHICAIILLHESKYGMIEGNSTGMKRKRLRKHGILMHD